MKSKAIKLIALDMDGTLLTHQNTILPDTKNKLLQLQQQGVRLVLASGRSYRKLMSYAKELDMVRYGGYLVEINGIAVYDLQHDKRTVLAQMKQSQVHELFHYFMQWDVEIIGHTDDGMYDYIPEQVMLEKQKYRLLHQLSEDHPWTAGAFAFMYDNREGFPKLIYVNHADEIKETLNKISVTYHPEVIACIAEQAKRELADKYWVGLTSERWLEIMIPGITKASGLDYLTKQLHIGFEEIMAFGDGENDIEMLQRAGIGIAMDNALDSVKQKAVYVTNSNEENGIANALHMYCDIFE